MDEHSMNHIFLKNRPRCFAKSSTVWDAFWLIPGLISYVGVTGRWRLLHISCTECSQVSGFIQKLKVEQ